MIVWLSVVRDGHRLSGTKVEKEVPYFQRRITRFEKQVKLPAMLVKTSPALTDVSYNCSIDESKLWGIGQGKFYITLRYYGTKGPGYRPCSAILTMIRKKREKSQVPGEIFLDDRYKAPACPFNKME